MAKMKDITGQKFGRLAVKSYHSRSKNGTSKWLCECECGSEAVVFITSLNSGSTKSCGCLASELATERVQTHGHTKGKELTPTYISWGNMLERVKDPQKNYINKDITVCEEWKSFENFLRDMGERPKGTTIDRIDNNKGYYKDNCRWASSKTQANNRSNNIQISFKGETNTLAEWCDILNLSYTAVVKRIYAGWDTDRALSTSVRQEKPARY